MSTITLINKNPDIPINVIIQGWNITETFNVGGPYSPPVIHIPYRPILGLVFNYPVSLLLGNGSNRSWFHASGEFYNTPKRVFDRTLLPDNIHLIQITPTCFSGFTYEAKYIGLDSRLKDSGFILIGDMNNPFPPFYPNGTSPIG
jgi:hypothetical protein